jgi:galactofuranose transport system ATP-binding protein
MCKRNGTIVQSHAQAQEEGVGIVFITHFMDQVYEISDRITVLRNGKLVGTYETASFTAHRS